jgi:two-component system OmpR family sensor kinase
VSLRAKLLLWMAVLLALGLGVSSFFVVRSTRANLVAQLDDQLLGARGPLRRPPAGEPPGVEAPSGRELAVVTYRDGQIVEFSPSGFASRPDPRPDVPQELVEGPPARGGEVLTVPSVDGSLSYRALVVPGQFGTTRVIAAPLDAVDRTIEALIRNIAIIGGIMLVALVSVGWLLLRQGLRPLETMATTATRISSGDLSQRVDEQDERSEVGRLGSAFNSMLDRIQQAFEEQRAALEAKERSERRLRQFVADASHELRTPLTTLRGYVDLYRTGALEEPAELGRAMSRIGSESARMGTLVGDLLLLARLDEGQALRQDAVDLSQLVGEAVEDERALEPARPLASSVEPGVRVTGDEYRLRQVVGNLLGNVRMHTSPTTALEVSLEACNGSCRLEIVDHGPGIDRTHAEHVFDRFYRADPGRSRDRGGSGLGLSIAQAIVDAHDGTIEHSATLGGGATFRISLPLADRSGLS